MVKPALYGCLLGTGLLTLLNFTTPIGWLADDLSPVRTPAEELATFRTEPGLTVQLVAAEPMIQDPVVITFDADGRLWVVEMRGFMPTVDGEGENRPVGRVSVLEDRNGDGQMDKSTVYLDRLVMPRALALVPGGVLIAENGALWMTTDRNGDLKADTKTIVDKDYAGGGLPEHAPNGLWQGMDNWYYNAKSRFRYRQVSGGWQKDSTEFRGQWGISHDDKGRLYYNYNWSQLHADLVPPNALSRNRHHTPTTGIDYGLTVDRRIYPIRATPAVNRGYIPGTLDKEGRIQEFTAACSPLVYRGTALPADYRGNVFVCEPAGNLVKRNLMAEEGPLLVARDPHPGQEFLASTDERFRPVHTATGPDGALYVADMYRGIIQHGAYMTPYLKEQTLARKLALPVNRGRIWRVVPQGWKALKPRRLSQATTDELIDELSSPDGWHRDMAQRQLMARADKATRTKLTQVAQKSSNPWARGQALWTLDGLQWSDPTLLLQATADPSAFVQTTALRLLEPIARNSQPVRTELGNRLLKSAATASAETALQMALTAQVLPAEASHPVLTTLVERHGQLALIRDAVLSSLQDSEMAFLQRLWKSPTWQAKQADREIFLETLTTAIVRRYNPGELTALQSMLNATDGTLNWQQKAVLSGLLVGAGTNKRPPVRLTAPPSVLAQLKSPAESARLAALTSLYEWPGQIRPEKTTAQNGKSQPGVLSDEDQKMFANGRQLYLNTCSGCHGTDGAGMARFAPPLIGSDWVTGDGKRLTLILLHGMEGPVDVAGKVYNSPDILPVMPAHSTLDDASITAILTYIRNEWGNQAGPLNRRLVGSTRVTSQGRVVPWTAKELNKYMEQTKAAEAK